MNFCHYCHLRDKNDTVFISCILLRIQINMFAKTIYASIFKDKNDYIRWFIIYWWWIDYLKWTLFYWLFFGYCVPLSVTNIYPMLHAKLLYFYDIIYLYFLSKHIIVNEISVTCAIEGTIRAFKICFNKWMQHKVISLK